MVPLFYWFPFSFCICASRCPLLTSALVSLVSSPLSYWFPLFTFVSVHPGVLYSLACWCLRCLPHCLIVAIFLVWFCASRCPVPFLQNTFLETLLGVALHAAQLEHRDANASVMKFLTELIRCGSAEPEKIGENEAEGRKQGICRNTRYVRTKT